MNPILKKALATFAFLARNSFHFAIVLFFLLAGLTHGNAQEAAQPASLIEHVIKVNIPDMKQITLFLRPPKGVEKSEDIQGVLVICALSGSLEELRRNMEKEELPGDYAGLFHFADQHKLAIIAWSASRLWDPRKNYEDLTKEEMKAVDGALNAAADAWARGARELSEKYGIPSKNFLLWGSCASAQWAIRLCLRKPELFLAAHIHMPGNYESPTPAASKVLWCLTIGELDSGIERSKDFLTSCRVAGYPVIYKAIVGLDHNSHPDVAALGFAFFEYALSQSEARVAYDEKLAAGKIPKPASGTTLLPWLESFQRPPFYGDMVNQEVFPADQVDMIPPAFRISLPTKEIADIWGRSK